MILLVSFLMCLSGPLHAEAKQNLAPAPTPAFPNGRDIWVTRMAYHLRKNNDARTFAAVLYYSDHHNDPGARDLFKDIMNGTVGGISPTQAGQTVLDWNKTVLEILPVPYMDKAAKLLEPMAKISGVLAQTMIPYPMTDPDRAFSDFYGQRLDFAPTFLDEAYRKLESNPWARKEVDQLLGDRYGIRTTDLTYDPETQTLITSLKLGDSLAGLKGSVDTYKQSFDESFRLLNRRIQQSGAKVLAELKGMRSELRSSAESERKLKDWNKELGELAGAADLIAFIGSRIDTKIGRDVKTMSNASLSIINSAKLFELGQIGKIAFSANVLSAGLAIAGMISGGESDPVQGQLQAIIGFLEEMAKQLNRIEEKIDRIYDLLVEQFKRIAYDLEHLKAVSEKTQRDVRIAYMGLSLLGRDVRSYVQALSDEGKNRDLRRCLDHEFVLVNDNYLGTDEFWSCLSAFATAAIDDSRSALWVNKNWDFRDGEILNRLSLPNFTESQQSETFRYNLNYLSGLAQTRYEVQNLPAVVPNIGVFYHFMNAYARMGLINFAKFPTYSTYSQQVRAVYKDIDNFFSRTIGDHSFHIKLANDYANKTESAADEVQKIWLQLVNTARGRQPAAALTPLKPCDGDDLGQLGPPEITGEGSLKHLIPNDALILEELDAAKIEMCYRLTLSDSRQAKEIDRFVHIHTYARFNISILVEMVLSDKSRALVNRRTFTTVGDYEASSPNEIKGSLQKIWESGRTGERVFVASSDARSNNVSDPLVPAPDEPILKTAFASSSRSALTADEQKSSRENLSQLVEQRFVYELMRATPMWDRYRAIFQPTAQNRFQSYAAISAYDLAVQRLFEAYEIARSFSEITEQFGAPLPACTQALDSIRPEILLKDLARTPFRGREASLTAQIRGQLTPPQTSEFQFIPAQPKPVCLADPKVMTQLSGASVTLELLERLQRICDNRRGQACQKPIKAPPR